MRFCKFILLLLLVLALFGCADKSVTEVTLYSGLSIVVSDGADHTASQAANCLQTYISNKTTLPMPSIVKEDPGQNAIVLKVDSAMEAGAYQLRLTQGGLHISGSDSHTLLYAVKLLRQAMIDNGNTTVITAALCQSLSGKVAELPFTFVTQNILNKEAEGGNSMADRSPRFQQLVAEYQPDILALQENSPDWQKYYQLYLGDTYTAVNQDKVTILLRKDRYTVQENGMFYLSPTPEVYSMFEGDSSPRVCTWAVVTDQRTDKTFLIFNTHLDWNNDTQRTLQLGVLFEQMTPYFEKYPTVGCGDFNSERESPIYSTVTQAFMDSAVSAERKLSTVDHTCHSFGQTTTYLDYIFHDEAFLADSHYIISEMYGGYVSDHYGVVTQFRFAS